MRYENANVARCSHPCASFWLCLARGIADKQGRLKAGDANKISLGMTKLQVMRALGKPETVSADSTGESLFYRLERPWWQDKPFKVQILDDKVVSFGVIESGK